MRSRRAPVLLLVLTACGRGDHRPTADAPDVAAAPAPASAATTTTTARVTFRPEGRPPVEVAVELAITAREIQRGLMYREHLPPEAGMLFLFVAEKPQSFWMKNTLIPLDLIFIRDDLTVAGVAANAEPRTLTSRRVDVPSRYVLEVNAGWAAAHGVVAGTRAAFDGVPIEKAYVE